MSAFGYPEGALSLARNMYEQFIIISFFENHKQDDNFQDYIDDYFIDYDLQRYKALKYEAIQCLNNIELQNQIESNIRKLKRHAHHKGYSNYWWANKVSFAQIVKEIRNVQEDDEMRSCTNRKKVI